MEINFFDDEHASRYADGCMRAAGKQDYDSQYRAAIFMVSAFPSVYTKVRTYITPDGINFRAALAEQVLSSGEQVYLESAYQLFSSQACEGFSLHDLVGLSSDYYDAVIMALKILR